MIVGSILPSDANHGVFAPKSLAFLAAAFFFSLFFIARWRLNQSQAWAALLILCALFFFGIWYLVGIDQNPLIPSGQSDQFKVFLVTLFVPFAAWYLIKERLITPQKILRTLIFANLAYSLGKVILMALHLTGKVNAWTVMHKTGFRYMSMNIFGEVGRIQTSVDILTPYLAFFVLQSDNLQLNLSKRFRAFYLVVSVASVFLSFSRVLIFGFALSILAHGLTLRVANQIKLWVLLSCLVFCGVLAIGPEKVEKVIERRLFSNDNYQSDATRNVQINALLNACDESPILGKGLGGYTTACIRDFALPYAYEVQWVAFLMQFGWLGIILLLTPLSIIAWKLIALPLTIPKLCYFLLFGYWLLSGFTNPFMISLTSGMIYMIFLLAAEITSGSKRVMLY
jgi:hypothetical protein